jgi:hypothetical protein
MVGRALLVAVAAVVLVVGYLVAAGAMGLHGSDRPVRSIDSHAHEVTWKASYSRQFPGCVASVLWPEHKQPVAVVVLLPGGEIERISTEAAAHGALRESRYEDARIIGACYPR